MTSRSESAGSLGAVHRTYAMLAEDVIRAMVADGRLEPGTRLNEVELAAELEISRGPLREAIQRLTNQGLLIAISHRGAFVRSFTRAQLEELYELRIALETFAVRVGAARATDAQIAELRDLLQQTQALMDGPTEEGYPGDLDFHRRLVVLSRNPQIIDSFDRAMQQVHIARGRSSSDPARARVALADHLDVLGHVVERDGGRAAIRLEEHLRGALESAAAVLALD